jgi:hypothetical protein
MSSGGDHAIVHVVAADDAELQRRLEALEAEVKADADAQRVRKDAAIARLREQQAQKQAEQAAAKPAKPAPAPRKKAREPEPDDDSSPFDDAVMVAKGAKLARQAQKELGRPREKGEKSWVVSSLLSLVLGPVGWLYAGSFREAIPASLLYVVVAAILSKLPIFLVWPVMMIMLPLSAIGGLVYSLQYNRHGKRMRLFDKEKKGIASGAGSRDKKRLPRGD